jgi:hypothetical protein
MTQSRKDVFVTENECNNGRETDGQLFIDDWVTKQPRKDLH